MCVCSRALFVFSMQSTSRSSQWQDRGRSVLTYRTTHLRKNSPLGTSPFSLSAFLLLRSFSPSLSDSSVSDPDRDPPQATVLSSPSPLSFSVFRSLTLSVSFYIMLSVKIPCGRAVCNKHNRTLWLYTLTLTCIRVSTHTQTLAWTHAVYASLVTLLCTTLFT